MKIIDHKKAPKPESMTLATNPMTIWLTKTRQLQIEKGDRLEDVTDIVMITWDVNVNRARRIVGFWFALGEAQSSQEFSRLNLSHASNRRYSPRTKKASS